MDSCIVVCILFYQLNYVPDAVSLFFVFCLVDSCADCRWRYVVLEPFHCVHEITFA